MCQQILLLIIKYTVGAPVALPLKQGMNQDCEPQYYMTFVGNVWQKKAHKQEIWLWEREQTVICK